VLKAIEALNFYPDTNARALGSGRSSFYGLIISDITNPFFPELVKSFEDIAVEHPDEETGDVWFGALAWSGSWRISVEQDQLQQIRVTGGFNPFDFSYKLLPGKQLETPAFYGGYSHHGVGGASRLLHRFELARIVPQAPTPKPRPG